MTPAPATYSVNSRLLTRMPHIHVPPKMANQSLGTLYEKAGVIEILPTDRLDVANVTYWKGRHFPYLAVCGLPLVKKYVVTTTKKVAYGQLQNPKSDLHNVHYCMPVLLWEEVGNNIYIAVLHFFQGQRVLEVTHNSCQCERFQGYSPWNMLKHWIVHRMDDIATCKELLCDDPQSFEYHPSPDHLGYLDLILDTIVLDSLGDDVMDGK